MTIIIKIVRAMKYIVLHTLILLLKELLQFVEMEHTHLAKAEEELVLIMAGFLSGYKDLIDRSYKLLYI